MPNPFNGNDQSQSYRFVLFEHDTLRQNFEIICLYCGKFSNFIPISFLTGFYVSQVVARWWNEFMTLPWPEKVAYRLVTFVPGNVRTHHLTQFIICQERAKKEGLY